MTIFDHGYRGGWSPSQSKGSLTNTHFRSGSGMVHFRLGVNGKAANMRFVDDDLRPRIPGWLVSVPVEGLIDKYAFRHRPGIIQVREDRKSTRLNSSHL